MVSPLNYKVSLYIHILGPVKLRYVFIRLFKWSERERELSVLYGRSNDVFFSARTIKNKKHKKVRERCNISLDRNSNTDRYNIKGVRGGYQTF